MSRRVIIFEDVDGTSSVLLSREHQVKEPPSPEEDRIRNIMGDDRMKILNGDDLQDMLNLLDGILEQPGRIVIFTSNYPERLDPAFLRPGRIDMNIRFGNCSATTVERFFKRFYPSMKYNIDLSTFHDLFSPALVQEIILQNLNNPQHAWDYLNQYMGRT